MYLYSCYCVMCTSNIQTSCLSLGFIKKCTHRQNRCIRFYSKQSECVSHLQKRTSHRKTSNSRHTLNGTLREGFTDTEKNPALILESRRETHATKVIVLHSTCSVVLVVPNTNHSRHIYTRSIHSLKKWAIAIRSADTFQPAADLLLAMLINLIQIILIQRHDLMIQCWSWSQSGERTITVTLECKRYR